MTRQRAVELGFDWEGTYWGIPIWFRERDNSVACKYAWCTVLLCAAARMDILASFFSGETHCFRFHIWPIEEEK